MKYVLFLQNLGLTPDQTSALLKKTGCAEYQPIWAGDAGLEAKKDDVEVIVTAKHVVGREELEPYSNARMASLAFTGYNDVDRAYGSSRQPPLQLYYVPGYSTESVAELAAGLALSLLRRLPLAHRRVVAGRWDRSETGETALVPGLELRGRTVGIVGTGTIGMYTAEIFRGFGCKIVAWSRKPKVEALELSAASISRASTMSFAKPTLSHSTWSSFRKPGTPRMPGGLVFLKPEAILLNVSRTGLVDLQALTAALRQKRFLGAALDVTEEHHLQEGLSDLLEMENVILTPHIGFRTDRALERLARITIENIGRFLRGDTTNRLEP